MRDCPRKLFSTAFSQHIHNMKKKWHLQTTKNISLIAAIILGACNHVRSSVSRFSICSCQSCLFADRCTLPSFDNICYLICLFLPISQTQTHRVLVPCTAHCLLLCLHHLLQLIWPACQLCFAYFPMMKCLGKDVLHKQQPG